MNDIPSDDALGAGGSDVQVERAYARESPVSADEEGNLWLLVGMDSGFEGRTELFYLLIEVTLEPVDS